MNGDEGAGEGEEGGVGLQEAADVLLKEAVAVGREDVSGELTPPVLVRGFREVSGYDVCEYKVITLIEKGVQKSIACTTYLLGTFGERAQ